MRKVLVAGALLWLAFPLQAHAYENFIPGGLNYAPGSNVLPPLNSEENRFNTQVDIYESDIYGRARRAQEFSSQLNHFENSHDLNGKSNFIDY